MEILSSEACTGCSKYLHLSFVAVHSHFSFKTYTSTRITLLRLLHDQGGALTLQSELVQFLRGSGAQRRPCVRAGIRGKRRALLAITARLQ
jgi:hypothetical protein